MGKFKQPGCCDCASGNCQASLLQAQKARLGFTPLYDSVANNKRRFFNYTLDFSIINSWAPAVGVQRDYHATVNITERRTGELTTSESSDPGNSTTLSANRSYAISVIHGVTGYRSPNGLLQAVNFHVNRDAANGTTYSSGVVNFGGTDYPWDDALTINFTKIGTAIVRAEITYVINYTHNEGIAKTETLNWVIEVDTEYTDAMLLDDLEELLAADGGITNHTTVPDNTLAVVKFDEAYTVIGLSSTAVALDITTLSSYTGLPDPDPEFTLFSDPGAYYGVTSQWWQHAGGSQSNGEDEFDPPAEGFSIYNCVFVNDGSMPALTGATNSNWTTAIAEEFRFNVGHQVCANFTVTNTSTSGTTDVCVLSTGTGVYRYIKAPDESSVGDYNCNRRSARTFTSPGYLTAGDCPCTNAP
jgi:hypothetical protein